MSSTNQPVPSREEIDRTLGPVLLEFGASWCDYCLALAPQLATVLAEHPEIQHIKIEDGPGKRLGRSFGVKLWPTLVFLRDGRAHKTAVRPPIDEVRAGVEAITANPSE